MIELNLFFFLPATTRNTTCKLYRLAEESVLDPVRFGIIWLLVDPKLGNNLSDTRTLLLRLRPTQLNFIGRSTKKPIAFLFPTILISPPKHIVAMSTAVAMVPSPAPHERGSYASDRAAPTAAATSTSPPARNAVPSLPRSQHAGATAASQSPNRGSPKSDHAAANKSSPNA